MLFHLLQEPGEVVSARVGVFLQSTGMLPEEGQALLVAYSDALGAAHYLEVAILGERAFLDGMRIVLKALEAERGGAIDLH